ncbi:MAG: matrixin family metalloprotease [Actinobacteria bacterium]|nr:matrixin family metalloprotease [Actinomycetota bacterium]
MTAAASTKRRIAVAVSGIAALALLASPLPTAAASAATQSAPMAAKSHTAKTVTKAPSKATTKVATKATAARTQAAAAVAAADYSSIFASQQPALTNSGWATCAAAITWTVDTSGLSADEAATQIANLTWAFDQWTPASGLAFQFGGTENLAYDDAAFSLKPANGSAIQSRHIYLAFIADGDSARLGGGTVGLGSPSQVWPTSKEIITGAAVFRTDHVKQANAREDKSLYMHELGHVLGLAHASETSNIMYPVVSDHTDLGTGDVNGVRSMNKPCNQAG